LRGDGVTLFGAGGDLMASQGVDLLTHVRDMASIGPREALSHLPRYWSAYRRLLAECRQRRASLALLLDFPEFNLRLAKSLKKRGIPVIYYISPQLWAWRRGRVRLVRDYVDRMLVILPFEEEFYRKRGVPAEFVGHPLLEDFAPDLDHAGFFARHGLDPKLKTIALLPGSRRREVEYILPTFIRAAQRILRRMPAQFVISAAPTVGAEYVSDLAAMAFEGGRAAASFKVLPAESRDILANSDFAFVKSGTSTLEAALVGTPFLIAYRISNASWYLGSILIRSPHMGLVNLIAGEEIVPELLQAAATPDALAATALEYLEEPRKAARMRSRLAGIRAQLGSREASATVAAIVRGYMSDGERNGHL
jgi:lipid-A-disaccharide synthase